jgi:hypothetical protein
VANGLSASARRGHAWLIPLVLILAIFLCFWPAVGFEFSSWDDGINVTENARFNPPRLSNIGWFWSHPFQNLYIPLTYSIWLLVALAAQTKNADVAGVTLNPYVFHLANLLLHLVAAGLVYSVLRRLFRVPLAAAAGALLFAIHPLQIEAVAWVTGFRDLLSGLFSLIVIDQYIAAFDERNGVAPKRTLHAAMAACAYVAALLSKPMAASLPIVLAGIDWFLLRPKPTDGSHVPAVADDPGKVKDRHRLVALHATVLLLGCMLAIPVIVIARRVQPLGSEVVATTLWSRPFIAGDAFVFYAKKLVAPIGLLMDYGRTPQRVLAHAGVYVSFVVAALMIFLAWRLRGRAPWLAAGMWTYLAALLPVLGFVPFGFQAYSTVADRYMYVAMLGPSVAIAGLLACAHSRRGYLLVGAALLMLGMVAHRQVWMWRDDVALYRHTLQINPDSYIANNNLAVALLEEAKPADALPYARKASMLNPRRALTRINLADCLAAVGDNAGAIDAYRAALQIQPTHAAARAKLALALASVHQADSARAAFERAVRDDPSQRRVQPELQRRLSADD